jgi:hypothetical protein
VIAYVPTAHTDAGTLPKPLNTLMANATRTHHTTDALHLDVPAFTPTQRPPRHLAHATASVNDNDAMIEIFDHYETSTTPMTYVNPSSCTLSIRTVAIIIHAHSP